MVAQRRRGRSLDHDTVTEVCAEAFRSDGHDRLGLELEWPLRTLAPAAGAQDDRPTAEQVERLDGVVLPAGGRVSWEPGGQVEISSRPADGVDDLLAAARADDDALADLLQGEGLERLEVSVDRTRAPRRILDRPRYVAMQAFFDAQGPCGRQMMTATAGTQVNLSHLSTDPTLRWRAMARLGPILAACFAHSPGRDAEGLTWASLRQGVWGRVDPGRTRPVPADGDPVLAWRDYALSADVLFIADPGSAGASGTAVPPGLPFGGWLLHDHGLGAPTAEDLRYHLTTLFPPIRPKGWLELRFLDQLPTRLREAAVLSAAVVAGIGADDLDRLPDASGAWTRAARYGLDDPFLRDAAHALLTLVAARLPQVSDDPAHRDLVRELRGATQLGSSG